MLPNRICVVGLVKDLRVLPFFGRPVQNISSVGSRVRPNCPRGFRVEGVDFVLLDHVGIFVFGGLMG